MTNNNRRKLILLIMALFFVTLGALSFFDSSCIIKKEAQEEAQEEELPSPQHIFKQQMNNLNQNLYQLEKRIHELVNVERSKKGLNTLSWCEDLANIARYHSKDMATRNYFNHVSPEGEDFSARYQKFGYRCENRVGNMVYRGGENLFLNNLVKSYTYDKDTGEVIDYRFNSIEEIAQSSVAGWMNSPGHRENILMPYFKKEGIGISITEDGKIYITENFC